MQFRTLRPHATRRASILASVLVCSFLLAAAQSHPPKLPKQLVVSEDVADSVLGAVADAAGTPGMVCGTSRALDEYLEHRYRLARHGASRDGFEAAGDVSERDGLFIVEADETILNHDRPGDLEGRTLHLTPESGGGYSASFVAYSYDPDVGTPVLEDSDSASAVSVDLANFDFPIGSSSYSTLWLSRDLNIRSNDPASAPNPIAAGQRQYGETSSALCGNLFDDRADRLSPYFHSGSGSSARFIYVKDTPTKFLVTWRRWSSDQGGTFHFDIQAALYPDGSVDYTYETTRNYHNGAPLIAYDLDDWFAGFAEKASASDPLEGFNPLAEITSFEVLEDPDTDIMQFRVALNDILPQSADPDVTYYLDLDQAGALRYRFYFQISPSGWSPLWIYTASAEAWSVGGNATVTDDVWEILISMTDMPDLGSGSIDCRAYTYEAGEFRDDITLSASAEGGVGFVRDYTAEAPFTSQAPIVETFLLPEFLPRGVKDKLLTHTGWDETIIDGIPMYQDFFTDIILYAGAYNAGGNCGAANMGMCDPEEPISPSLLHMNKTNYGWNNPDEDYRFQVLSHELGHHWLQNILIDEGDGNGPTDVLNPESAHPAAYVHTEAEDSLVFPEDTSVMGGGYWMDNGDGTYTSFSEYTYYSFAAYELYLMGLMTPDEVANWFYLNDTDPPQPLSYWPSPDTTVTGERRDVDIDMVLAAMGTRDPLYPDAKTDFFTPMVLVVRAGKEPEPEAWDFMMTVRHPWRDAFSVQTLGRGSVTTVSPREVSPPGAASQLRVSKLENDELRFRFEDPDFADQVRYNLYEGALGSGFETWESNLCGAAASSTDGDLYLDATPNLTGSAYFLVTMSNVAVEGDAGNASDGTERTTSEPRCGGW